MVDENPARHGGEKARATRALLFLAAGALLGCGVKAPPRPPLAPAAEGAPSSDGGAALEPSCAEADGGCPQ